MPDEMRAAVIELAAAMAERIVHAEIERDPQLLNKMFASTLASAVGLEGATVTVHSEDRAVSEIDAAAQTLGFSVETDDTSARGSLRVCGAFGTVDATVSTLVNAMKQVLKDLS